MPEYIPTVAQAGGTAARSELLDTVIVRPRPGVAVLDVDGELDTLTAPLLESAITEFLDATEATLVVDLSDVTFLASSGLAVLIRATHRAGGSGPRLRLVAATRAVRRPLEITGTDQLFDMYTDVDTATGASD